MNVVGTVLYLEEQISCREKNSCPQLSVQLILSIWFQEVGDWQTAILYS